MTSQPALLPLRAATGASALSSPSVVRALLFESLSGQVPVDPKQSTREPRTWRALTALTPEGEAKARPVARWCATLGRAQANAERVHVVMRGASTRKDEGKFGARRERAFLFASASRQIPTTRERPQLFASCRATGLLSLPGTMAGRSLFTVHPFRLSAQQR